MNLKTRSYKKELLDSDNIPFDAIRQNMAELNAINTLLGGHAITIKGLQKLLKDRPCISVCEIGCGGGDNLVAIAKQMKHLEQLSFTGIDIKKECIDYAIHKNKGLLSNAKWIVSDYNNVSFEQKPDIIFSSLFCHHFTNDELIKQLQWMRQNSSIGFFINDLHRHQLAYYSIKLLTSVFSKSYLVKNDAPLSVARGFSKKEWLQICTTAGIQPVDISWQWAFRHLIVFKHA